jgi:hypothetical protein
MQIYKNARMKKNGNSILLIVALSAAVLTVFLPAARLRAEEPVQMANVGQYDVSMRYTAAVENNVPAENTPSANDFSSMSTGIDAVSCAIFGDIPAVVDGPTVIEFWWRGSNAGTMLFVLNNSIQAVQYKDNGWIKYRLTINKKGAQQLKWVYRASAEGYASIQP